MNIKLLESIIDNTQEGIVILGDDFMFEYVNNQACLLFGGPKEDLIGKDVRDFLTEDSVMLVTERFLMRRQGLKPPAEYNIEIIRKDGKVRTASIKANLTTQEDGSIKTIGYVLDITGQEIERRALEKTQARYRTLVETMFDGLAIDDEHGRITYANESFCKMLGYTREEMLTKEWADLTEEMGPRDVKRKREERKKGISERYELNWKTKSGAIVPTIISATPYFNPDGNFEGTFAVVTVISRQKELEQTQQFYLDLITHDIANQLQVIITASGLIDSELPGTYIEDAKVDILDAVDRCNRLITKVKRAAELRFIPLQKTDFRTVLREKVMALEKIYGVKVEFENIKKKLYVQADILLGELIWNLLENAVKHNPKKEKQIWVSGHRDNGMFNLSIADDGPGLSDARKANLFERRKGSGGVGLTLVSQMARKYGGHVSVHDRIEGKPSLGAKFVVSLQITK